MNNPFEVKIALDVADREIDAGKFETATHRINQAFSNLRPGKVADTLAMKAVRSMTKMITAMTETDRKELMKMIIQEYPDDAAQWLRMKLDEDPTLADELRRQLEERGIEI